jgi:hypothetical protein
MIRQPQYIGLEEARQVLAEMGVALSLRQMKRAADPAGGRRLISLCFITEKANGDHHWRRMVGHCCSRKRRTDRRDCR